MSCDLVAAWIMSRRMHSPVSSTLPVVIATTVVDVIDLFAVSAAAADASSGYPVDSALVARLGFAVIAFSMIVYVLFILNVLYRMPTEIGRGM